MLARALTNAPAGHLGEILHNVIFWRPLAPENYTNPYTNPSQLLAQPPRQPENRSVLLATKETSTKMTLYEHKICET